MFYLKLHMTRSKISFRSLHLQMKLFLTPHCPTPKNKSEFLTLGIQYLKYKGAYIKQKHNLNSLLFLYCYK